MELLELEKLLHKRIPISRKMGLAVKKYNGQRLELKMPLQQNKNHKSTAFGGSIYSVMVLTGWSMVFLKLKEHGLKGHVVIKNSQIDYIKPIEKNMVAMTEIENDQQIEKFITRFSRRKMARIYLTVIIKDQKQMLAKMTGEYVVTK